MGQAGQRDPGGGWARGCAGTCGGWGEELPQLTEAQTPHTHTKATNVYTVTHTDI